MPKAMSIFGMVVAGLLGLTFTLDMVLGQPFGGQSMSMDIGFLICSVILGYLGWNSLREN